MKKVISNLLLIVGFVAVVVACGKISEMLSCLFTVALAFTPFCVSILIVTSPFGGWYGIGIPIGAVKRGEVDSVPAFLYGLIFSLYKPISFALFCASGVN